MKKEEAKTLIVKKESEGKSQEQIKKELNHVDTFIKETKSNLREIVRLNKVIEKQEKEIDKLKKEIFNLKLKR